MDDIKTIVSDAVKTGTVDDLQQEIFNQTKKPVGRPSGTTKIRRSFRVEARSIELMDVVATATGEGRGNILEIATDYYAEHILQEEADTPAISLHHRSLLQKVWSTPKHRYADEIKAGKWSKQ